MKTLYLAMPLIAIATVASAATKKDAFTCDSIKEKQVRMACIESRNELVAKIEVCESKISEKDAAYDLRIKQESLNDTNVKKAKADLTKNYKDPASAQFSDLTLRESNTTIALCGSVNGKNSYGGYVGVRRFYVTWQKITPLSPMIWSSGEHEKYLNSKYPSVQKIAQDEILREDEAFHKICDADKDSVITMIN